MDRIYSILRPYGESVLYGILTLSIGFVLFFLLERLFSLSRRKKAMKSTLLDYQYAFLSMLYQPFISFLLAAFFGVMAIQLHGAAQEKTDALGFGVQLLAILFVRDCLIYIRHRFFHLRQLWAFHSVHHSSEEVDWISAVRFHPFENMIESLGEILLFLGCRMLGADAAVLSVAGFVMGFYNFFIHSNLKWTFGPLSYLLVSPVFHRWHHSDAPEACDKNFAAMFSCIDLALGTFYMPENSIPETLGLSLQEKGLYPRTLVGQLLYPFRKR